MLYLLWALLNIGLFVFFIVICFRATKLVRQKIGLLAAVIFVFGLLSFMGGAASNHENLEPASNHIKTWKFTSEDSLKGNAIYSMHLDLEKTLISKYSLGINYGKDMEEKMYIPISAYTTITGFVSGTSWKPTSIIVNPTDDNQKFEYEVIGTVKWKLLGFAVYYQSKNWKGMAFLR